MISIHKEIRKRMKAPMIDVDPNIDYQSLRNTEWCSEFISLMGNRLVMGALRYEPFHKKKDKIPLYNLIKTAIKKLYEYEKTGNDEILVDVANYMLIEYKYGIHPKKHFKATDDSSHAIQSS